MFKLLDNIEKFWYNKAIENFEGGFVMKVKKIFCSGLLACSMLANLTALASSAVDVSIGDSNADSVVNAEDASEILMKCAQIGTGEPITEEEFAVMDINGDGKIGADDASLVLQYSAKSGAKVMPEFPDYVAQRLSEPVFYGAKYIQDDAIDESYCHQGYVLITSAEEFEEFVSEVYANTEDELKLKDTLVNYDSVFFEDHDLLVICDKSGCAEAYYEAQGITTDENGSWVVTINKMFPIVMSPIDPAWAIMIETNKAVEFAPSIKVDMIPVMFDPWADSETD